VYERHRTDYIGARAYRCQVNVARTRISDGKKSRGAKMTDRTEMKPTKDPIKSTDFKEAVDTEDYFDLAYEADEFGVHAPDQADK
jgi:hypothetical protein